MDEMVKAAGESVTGEAADEGEEEVAAAEAFNDWLDQETGQLETGAGGPDDDVDLPFLMLALLDCDS